MTCHDDANQACYEYFFTTRDRGLDMAKCGRAWGGHILMNKIAAPVQLVSNVRAHQYCQNLQIWTNDKRV